jgi:cellulose synthase/poly-beta-1,6-N-acetylglucosamine synthase-like glycosyltransferase
VAWGASLFGIVIAVVSAVLFSSSAATLWWMLHAWRTPEVLENTKFAQPLGPSELTFSLLVPARHEELVLEHTIRRLLESTHPDYEILVIVGHDDPATAEVACRLAEHEPDRVRVITDHNDVKNKPKALNAALSRCRGDVVGVFDAEDQVHPDLLTHVDHAFRSTGAQVVQGGVQLINFDSSWYSLRNCLEYFFWFRSRLHLHARKGFIPLGGNTVFIRTEVLLAADGWDEQCLAEDCDLGVRLSSLGHRVVVAYEPELVTREETPHTLKALFKQRTRWNQGFLQVLRKKDWHRLPTFWQRFLASYTLTSPFLQAFSGILVPLGIVLAFFMHVPIWVAMLTFIPALPTLATLAFEVVGLHDFGWEYGFRIRFTDYVKLVLGSPFYGMVLAAASIRAIWREGTGRNNWELTRHLGQHLATSTAP